MNLVVDTNSLKAILLDKKEEVFKKCHVIYIPPCVEKELEGVLSRAHLAQLRKSIHAAIGEFKSMRKFNVKRPHAHLPEKLKKALIKAGADECDMNIVRLALERKKKSGKVIIITRNKEHFQRVPEVITHVGGRENIIFPEEYN